MNTIKKMSFLLFIVVIMVSCRTSEDGESGIGLFTIEEFYNFEFLNHEYSKEQMDQMDLKKEVNKEIGTTVYSNDFIKYTYYDWYSSSTPNQVEVFGKCSGPRGISVGDDFEDVLARFPQDKDWRTSEHGEFYGQIHETEYREDVGYVYFAENIKTNETKEIILLFAKGAQWLTIYFRDEAVSRYVFYIMSD